MWFASLYGLLSAFYCFEGSRIADGPEIEANGDDQIVRAQFGGCERSWCKVISANGQNHAAIRHQDRNAAARKVFRFVLCEQSTAHAVSRVSRKRATTERAESFQGAQFWPFAFRLEQFQFDRAADWFGRATNPANESRHGASVSQLSSVRAGQIAIPGSSFFERREKTAWHTSHFLNYALRRQCFRKAK